MSTSSNTQESAIDTPQSNNNTTISSPWIQLSQPHGIQTPPVMGSSWPSLSLSSIEPLSPQVQLPESPSNQAIEIENSIAASVSTEVEVEVAASHGPISENSGSRAEPQRVVSLSSARVHSRPAQTHTSRNSNHSNFQNHNRFHTPRFQSRRGGFGFNTRGRNREYEVQNQNYINRDWDFDQSFNPNPNPNPRANSQHQPHRLANGLPGINDWNLNGSLVNYQHQPNSFANGSDGFVGPLPLPPPYPFGYANVPPLVPGHMHPFEHYGDPYFQAYTPLDYSPGSIPAPHAEVIRGPALYPQPQSLSDDILLCTRIRNQIEFYFSDQNFWTDDYLRRHMDEQGWVHVGLIAGFPRIKAMTNDLDLILRAVRPSWVIEVHQGKMRKHGVWISYTQSHSPLQDMVLPGIRNIQLDRTA